MLITTRDSIKLHPDQKGTTSPGYCNPPNGLINHKSFLLLRRYMCICKLVSRCLISFWLLLGLSLVKDLDKRDSELVFDRRSQMGRLDA